MSLAPKFAGQMLAAGKTQHTLELYLDYVCPFSAKMFTAFHDSVTPLIKKNYANNLRVILRQQIQPWHPSSTLVHEAAAAVLRLSPDKFWDFSRALFKDQQAYFDVSVVNETRNSTYKRLAKLAGSVGVGEAEVFRLLEISDKPGKDGALNVGNGVTDDMKVMVKANRVVGVHVTPTVFFNGLEEKSISSSFTADQWKEWLEKNVV